MFSSASMILISWEPTSFVFALKKSDLIKYPLYEISTSPDKYNTPSFFLKCAVSELNLIISFLISEAISDPQKHTEILFANNISSRILEKDNFKQKYPCL